MTVIVVVDRRMIGVSSDDEVSECNDNNNLLDYPTAEPRVCTVEMCAQSIKRKENSARPDRGKSK